MTAYVGPHQWEKSDGREVVREFRVDSSEAHPGHLAIGTYNWSTGNDLGTAHLPREQVAGLRDALTAWLQETEK